MLKEEAGVVEEKPAAQTNEQPAAKKPPVQVEPIEPKPQVIMTGKGQAVIKLIPTTQQSEKKRGLFRK